MLANPAIHPAAYMPHPGDSPGMPGLKPVSATKEEMNEADIESDPGSEKEDASEIESEKLDASHREIIEKLKRQEMEERQEIERELEEAQREASIQATHERNLAHENDLGKDNNRDSASSHDSDSEQQLEIKMQRPLGLLASHGLTTKSHSSHSLYEKEREKEREKAEREKAEREKAEREKTVDRENDMIVPSPTSKDEERGTPDEWAQEQNIGLDYSRTGPSFNERAFMPSPPLSSPQQNSNDLLGASPGHHWTFEEQFKQLYELSNDAKRREFLDDLFSFMQKRGTPVNRIPIMAKQTLDLYELFRLVVSKGGLVEVINKKLWREITKGLNLPSSITSAAFTLRTQYMKYLYPYECDKLKLSSPNELQTAIDGNRREGRRPSYGYDFSPVPTMIPTGPPLPSGPPPPMSHLNGALLNGRPDIGSSSMSVGFPLQAAYGAVDMKLSNGCCSSGEDENSVPASTHLHIRTLAERDARAMEAAARAMEEATNRMSEASRSTAPPTSVTPIVSLNHHHRSMLSSQKMEPPPKRLALDEDRLAAHMGMPSAHLKITSRNDGRAEFDNSLVVSMEINGIMYQGVLFAQHPRRL